MNDSGQLLFFLAMMAVLALMDTFTRRARRRRIEEMERGDDERAGHELGEEDPYAPFKVEPQEPEIRVESPRSPDPGKVPIPLGIDEESPVEIEPSASDETRRHRSSGRATAPPLLSVTEELRERGRSDAKYTPGSPVLDPRGGGPLPSVARPRSRAERLRSLFRRGPDALRSAVLYREILGEPLGWRRHPGGWEDPGRRFLRTLEGSDDAHERRKPERR